MKLSIRHVTRYRFDGPGSYGLQQLRKTPKTNAGQSILTWETRVEGGKKELAFEDQHLNVVELISFERDVSELSVISEGTVSVTETHGVIGRHRGPAPLWLYERPTPRTKVGPAVRKLVRMIEGESDLDRLHGLKDLIKEEIVYEVGSSLSGGTAEEAATEGRGVCQDHAHVFIACARELGYPARYVSGYLMMDDRVEQDAMHAWAEAHVEGLGWVGFDPANGISPDKRYVRVATGLDYADAAPVTGLKTGGGGESMSVEIAVAQQ
ncbi:transglutaminase family protein [Aestuariicoccus sp. KMU-90]|uniref:Transglutaminase family protein n=1 Tax=Thetidibacter halocola TaxID=2827239 RepID=A0A8J7WJ29_9RHOB|nr:transglutaminase family protein [Thetidibacter halocola]